MIALIQMVSIFGFGLVALVARCSAHPENLSPQPMLMAMIAVTRRCGRVTFAAVAPSKKQGRLGPPPRRSPPGAARTCAGACLSASAEAKTARCSAQGDLAFVGTAQKPGVRSFALTGVRQVVAVAAQKISAAEVELGHATAARPPVLHPRADEIGAPAAKPARRPGEPHGFFHIRPVLAVAAHPVVQDQLVRGSAETDAGHLLAVSPPLPTAPISRLKASCLVEPVDVERAVALHLPLPARPSRTIAAQVVFSRVLRNPLRINLGKLRVKPKIMPDERVIAEGNQAHPEGKN